MKKDLVILYSFLAVIIAIVIFFFIFPFKKTEARTDCADFSTQILAQQAFKADPLKYRDLDRNKDGFACEKFKYK